MTTKTLSKKSGPRQNPPKRADALLRKQLKTEHEKRLLLCEALLFCAGVDHRDLEHRDDFLKHLCRVAADDLDTLVAALEGSATENPRTPDFVSRLADRLRHAHAVDGQVNELLRELQTTEIPIGN